MKELLMLPGYLAAAGLLYWVAWKIGRAWPYVRESIAARWAERHADEAGPAQHYAFTRELPGGRILVVCVECAAGCPECGGALPHIIGVSDAGLGGAAEIILNHQLETLEVTR